MSSDNYNLVRKRADGRWDAWQNLDASSGYVPKQADATFDTFDKAFGYADEGYAEYGTRVEATCSDVRAALGSVRAQLERQEEALKDIISYSTEFRARAIAQRALSGGDMK